MIVIQIQFTCLIHQQIWWNDIDKSTLNSDGLMPLGYKLLTHLPLDKMAAVLADNIFKCIFLNEGD